MTSSTADARTALLKAVGRRYTSSLFRKLQKQPAIGDLDEQGCLFTLGDRQHCETFVDTNYIHCPERRSYFTSPRNLGRTIHHAKRYRPYPLDTDPSLESSPGSSSANPWRSWRGNLEIRSLEPVSSTGFGIVEVQDDLPSLLSDSSSDTSSTDIDLDLTPLMGPLSDWTHSKAENELASFYKDLWEESDRNFDSYINLDACGEPWV